MESDGAAVLTAEVQVAADLPDDDRHQLIDDLRSLGLNPTTKTALLHRGVSDIVPWLVLIALPLQPFLNTLVEKLASDTYTGLKALVVRVFRHRHEPEDGTRVLILEDTVTGVQVVLEPDLPAEGYHQLQRLDLSTITRGPLRYDRSKREWRCEFDEPLRTSARTR